MLNSLYAKNKSRLNYNTMNIEILFKVLEKLSKSKQTVILNHGNSSTGVSWSGDNLIAGKVSSNIDFTEFFFKPLDRESFEYYGYSSGRPIMEANIVRVSDEEGGVLWEHDNYRPLYNWNTAEISDIVHADVIEHPTKKFKVRAFDLFPRSNLYGYLPAEVVARFESYEEAEEYIKMKIKFESRTVKTKRTKKQAKKK